MLWLVGVQALEVLRVPVIPLVLEPNSLSALLCHRSPTSQLGITLGWQPTLHSKLHKHGRVESASNETITTTSMPFMGLFLFGQQCL